MAPVFEQCDEMNSLIQELKDKREDLFGFVDPVMISCGLRTDKPEPKSQKWSIKIEGFRGSKTLANSTIKYIIWGYESRWSELSRIEKLGHMANSLLRIRTPTEEEIAELAETSDEWEWGKLKAPDIIDFKSWLKAFGVDWMDKKDNIPNILDEKTIITE